MITRLVARNFRNLEELSLSPGEGVHLLLGGTGAGKTSVLEAIYLVATTRSFRTNKLADCLRHPGAEVSRDLVAEASPGADFGFSSGFYLQAEAGFQRDRLEFGWGPREDGSRSSWRHLNGKAASLADYLEVLPLLAWTAADGEVLVGEPELRRRLLDRGVVAKRPGKIALLTRYRRILQQKRKLLLKRQSGLESWNDVLAGAAVELCRERSLYVGELNDALAAAHARTTLGTPEVRLRYRPSTEQALEGEEEMRAALQNVSAREREDRRALLGPHRDRLDILWGGRPIRTVASAGERKSAGLLLLVAQADVLRAAERNPTLLLDDADTELDQRSLEALWPAIRDSPQCFVSSNRPDVWRGLGIDHRWQVEAGRVDAC